MAKSKKTQSRGRCSECGCDRVLYQYHDRTRHGVGRTRNVCLACKVILQGCESVPESGAYNR